MFTRISSATDTVAVVSLATGHTVAVRLDEIAVSVTTRRTPKPVELPQDWSNMITSTSAGDESRCRVLHQLKAPEQTVCDATEQRVTIVEMTSYKTLHKRHSCIDGH